MWDGRKAEVTWTVYCSEDMLWWTHKGVLGLLGAGESWAPLHYKVGGGFFCSCRGASHERSLSSLEGAGTQAGEIARVYLRASTSKI